MCDFRHVKFDASPSQSYENSYYSVFSFSKVKYLLVNFIVISAVIFHDTVETHVAEFLLLSIWRQKIWRNENRALVRKPIINM